MSECDLCDDGSSILYPVKINPFGSQDTKHLCSNCIEAVKAIENDE